MGRGARGFPRWLLWVLPGCAGVLAAATACGSVAAHPVAGGSSSAPASPSALASASPSASPSVSPSASAPAPIPSAILRAVTDGGSGRITVVRSPGSVLAHPAQSQAAALRTALAQEPHGSQILGLTLARVQGFGFGSDMSRAQLAWLVSVDPYGGAYGAGGPACGRLSFVVEFIDPATGQWLMATSGKQSGLRPIPALGPTPSTVQPSRSCGPAIPRMHQGTPAAS